MRRWGPLLAALLLLVLGGLAVWWAWPDAWRGERADPTAKVVRPERRPAWTRQGLPRGITLPPETRFEAPPDRDTAEPVEVAQDTADTGLVEEERGMATISGWVVDSAGTNVGGGGMTLYCTPVGGVLPPPPPFGRGVPADAEGFFEVEVDAPSDCVFQGLRRDGLLVARSRRVDMQVEPGDFVEIDLIVPAARTGGLGVQIAEHPDGILIQKVHEGTPAYEAGLVDGDVIVEVEGRVTVEDDLNAFIERVTGPEDSEVGIVVQHEDGTESPMVLRRRFLDRQLIR